ncbi:transcriptional regulator [Kibdelosporangium persicum]|uniref:transcriptional regulator n=1 Tax=Kibdelosporangium persicum TaxID=2698649 RepID=UPI00156473C4|nr:transcriptional regulator [Kibdelosporangium persicum]
MAQVSWRADEDLVDRVRRAAAAQRRSMNDFITLVLEAATNPDLEQDEYTRVRERLSRMDLVVTPMLVYVDDEGHERPRTRPSREAVEKARKAAGRGKPLSDYVSEGRGE